MEVIRRLLVVTKQVAAVTKLVAVKMPKVVVAPMSGVVVAVVTLEGKPVGESIETTPLVNS